jgi:hypothetical protein
LNLGPKKPRRRSPLLVILIVLLAIAAIAVLVYNIPFFNERLAWRVEAFRAEIKYALEPPEEVVFQPNSSPTAQTWTATPSSTPDLVTGTPPPQPGLEEPTPTQSPVPTETPVPTPLPASALLGGFNHQYQSWNNCGPANLAMALSYWGWDGNQADTAAYTKPNPRDKNVMPYEMADYVADQTELSAVVRVGGDLETLKAFIAAGFPVIVEKSFEGPRFDGWMGHYEVVNGYNDDTRLFTVQDSYDGPDITIPYDDMTSQWRAFNNTYIVIYPPDREAEVLSILGPHADPVYNSQAAADRAADGNATLTGRDQYFSLFNWGTNLVRLHDYTTAATAYDAAFANYPSLPESERPWRMLWYQTGPYFAYYYSGRYQDVIDLATTTLEAMSEPVLEESYYWRAMARLAVGETELAVDDLRTSLKHHPDFVPSLELLRQLGEQP